MAEPRLPRDGETGRGRIEQTEESRAKAEAARQASEEWRREAEDQRAVHEQTRESAESVRATSEESRMLAEDLRDMREQLRQAAEEARRTAEEARQAAAEIRELRDHLLTASAETRRAAEELRLQSEMAQKASYDQAAIMQELRETLRIYESTLLHS